jgi:release factor glutamine methyltransferase
LIDDDKTVVFDLVVANLPYIPRADVPLKPDPVGFEPIVALDGGPDGLQLYRELLAQLPSALAENSLVLLEAAPPTIPALLTLVEQLLPLGASGIGYDYASLQRFVYWQR